VQFDEEGRPFSVHYEQLPPMLLNEIQKQQRVNEGQAVVIDEQRRVIAALADRLEAVEAGLVAAPTGRDR
jgi:hypothetical protein